MLEPLKIGILGTRGIPNAYGGFEQFAQYLSLGLARKGHQVWVYNSHTHPYQERSWNGVNLIHCKDPEKKLGTLGQFIYDYNCFRDARCRNYDILFQLGYTSNSIWHRIWPRNTRNIVNMDGLEWKRNKYNKPVQKFLKYAELLAVRHADMLIADSVGIQNYLLEAYDRPSFYIPYGATPFENPNVDRLSQYDLEAGKYFMLLARMEPENNIETIIQGYLLSDQRCPLLIVSNPKNKFGKYLQGKYNNKNILFAGAIFDQDIVNNLRYFSSMYFHGHSVGGTNPSLLEAMASHCNIIAHDNIFNRAVLGDDAWYFCNAHDIGSIINNNDSASDMISHRKSTNMQKIKTLYSWDAIIEAHEKVFLHALTH